ncbi:hypothetical protein C8J57DRAFT_1543254 [Mycena rebaudengoi]|nr:hypothetical protein C8J57DRAFT_1543254 [Mycena rebaudengoi]
MEGEEEDTDLAEMPLPVFALPASPLRISTSAPLLLPLRTEHTREATSAAEHTPLLSPPAREKDLGSPATPEPPPAAALPVPASSPPQSPAAHDVHSEEDSDDAEEEETDLGLALVFTGPAWAQRAAAAPALGLSAQPGWDGEREGALAFPGAFPGTSSVSASVGESSALKSPPTQQQLTKRASPAGGRTQRSPLDVALAMQLRPGMGVGAEGAWLVRFLMSFFGWFAVLVAGGREFS